MERTMSDDPNPTFRDVASCAIGNLIEHAEALSVQLSFERGGMSEEQMEDELSSYLTPDTWTLESLVRHVTILSEVVPALDSETVVTAFKCDVMTANEAIVKSAEYCARRSIAEVRLFPFGDLKIEELGNKLVCAKFFGNSGGTELTSKPRPSRLNALQVLRSALVDQFEERLTDLDHAIKLERSKDTK